MTSSKREPSEFTHISSIIESLLPRSCREGNTEIARLRRIWDEIVSGEISENAQPAALKNNTLLVHVKSPTLIHQLRFMENDIRQSLNAASSSEVISSIKFKVGKV